MIALLAGIGIGLVVGAVTGYWIGHIPRPLAPESPKSPTRCEWNSNSLSEFRKVYGKNLTNLQHEQLARENTHIICAVMAEHNCAGGFCEGHCQERCNSSCPCKIINKKAES